MSRKLKNNIVIVCEGTETEYHYLKELKSIVEERQPERFSDIRIIPTPEELNVCVKRNQVTQKRSLKGSSKAGRYYTQEEELLEDYERYKQQPTRYVREAQLYLADGSYAEAWAVYDFDNFPDHANARALADEDEHLHIAFSSVSFEEWLLLHFELNRTAFQKSVCKEAKKDIRCGTGKHAKDCKGSTCVGGRLRAQNFLPDYDKCGDNLFTTLESRLEHARIGSAWTRTLHPAADIWLQNPYTDFDRLVNHLLGYPIDYKWVACGEIISTVLTQVSVDNGNLFNVGGCLFVLDVTVYDKQFNNIESNIIRILPGEFCHFDKGDYISFSQNGESVVIVPLHS